VLHRNIATITESSLFMQQSCRWLWYLSFASRYAITNARAKSDAREIRKVANWQRDMNRRDTSEYCCFPLKLSLQWTRWRMHAWPNRHRRILWNVKRARERASGFKVMDSHVHIQGQSFYHSSDFIERHARMSWDTSLFSVARHETEVEIASNARIKSPKNSLQISNDSLYWFRDVKACTRGSAVLLQYILEIIIINRI